MSASNSDLNLKRVESFRSFFPLEFLNPNPNEEPSGRFDFHKLFKTLDKATGPLDLSCYLAKDSELTSVMQAVLQPDIEMIAAKYSRHRESELFRRLDQKLWERLLGEVAKVPHDVTSDTAVQLSSGQWESPLFSRKDLMAIAFKAYFEGLITEETLVLIALYDAAKKESHNQVEIHNLRDNQEALNLFLSGSDSFVNGVERESFSAFLQSYAGRTDFFSIPIDLSDTGALIPYSDTEGFGFGISKTGDQARLIIIPPRLMFALFESKFRHNAMVPHPVFGFSTPEDFTHPEKRDVWIPFPYEATDPNERLHGKKTSKLTAYWHDCNYHSTVESGNPNRKLWLLLAKEFENCGMDATWNYVLDRNFPETLFMGDNDAEKFLIALIRTFILFSSEIPDDIFTPGLTPDEALKAKQRMLNFLDINEHSIQAQFNIDVKPMIPLLASLLQSEALKEAVRFRITKNLLEQFYSFGLLALELYGQTENHLEAARAIIEKTQDDTDYFLRLYRMFGKNFAYIDPIAELIQHTRTSGQYQSYLIINVLQEAPGFTPPLILEIFKKCGQNLSEFIFCYRNFNNEPKWALPIAKILGQLENEQVYEFKQLSSTLNEKISVAPDYVLNILKQLPPKSLGYFCTVFSSFPNPEHLDTLVRMFKEVSNPESLSLIVCALEYYQGLTPEFVLHIDRLCKNQGWLFNHLYFKLGAKPELAVKIAQLIGETPNYDDDDDGLSKRPIGYLLEKIDDL